MNHSNNITGIRTAKLTTRNGKWIATVDMRSITDNDIRQLLSLGYRIVLDDSSMLEVVEHIDILA